MMELIIVRTVDAVDEHAASKVADLISRRPSAVIGLATGSSPLGLYRKLGERVKAGSLSFREASGFALDEYVGMSEDHPQAYVNVVSREIVGPLGFRPSRVHVPNGRADNLNAAAKDFEQAIAAAGGIDLQILGIGANAHIGFNEPGSPISSRTRVTTLAMQTRQDNGRFFGSIKDVPTRALTQGLGTILEAREVLLVATGLPKAEAVAAAFEGPVSPCVPASALQLHPSVVVILDEPAASKLVGRAPTADFVHGAHRGRLESSISIASGGSC